MYILHGWSLRKRQNSEAALRPWFHGRNAGIVTLILGYLCEQDLPTAYKVEACTTVDYVRQIIRLNQ